MLNDAKSKLNKNKACTSPQFQRKMGYSEITS